jgi:ABC-type antimicrobial peptide transport system permease subunit
VGVILGLGLSALVSRLLTTILFGVTPLDPVTFVSVTLILAVTGAAAIAGPTWRATRVDPVLALRDE